MTTWDLELAFARAFAAHACRLVQRASEEGHRSTTKDDQSPVTATDIEINEDFIRAVETSFPLDAVRGEEASLPRPGSRCWVIDPIDGTQQLLLGIPVSMVSIALVVDGQPQVAVAANPATAQTYRATAGGGAFRDEERLQVSTRDGRGSSAIICGAGSIPSPVGLSADTLMQMTEHTLTPIRFPWPSVFSGCKVAEGSWDADLYSGSMPHDVAAVCLLVQEAGGRVTDRAGASQRYDRDVNGCLLSNGHVHDDLVTEWTKSYVPRRP